MRRPVKIAFFATALVLLVAGAAMAQSYTYAVNLARGETAYVTCSGAQRLSVDRQGLIAILACGRPDQVQPTATPLPPVPTATATPAPPPPDPGALLPVEPLSMLGSCTAEIHDRYTVVGPDGNRWRTWHPQRDPSGCTFAHEHGDDPRTSNADNSLPAFGYIGSLVGRVEAHEGFKVYVANRGDVNDENRTAQTDSRVVVHMTTGRPLPGMTGGRFTMPFHSLEYDMVAPDGHEVHVAGMANTFSAGLILRPRPAQPDRQPHRARSLYRPGRKRVRRQLYLRDLGPQARPVEQRPVGRYHPCRRRCVRHANRHHPVDWGGFCDRPAWLRPRGVPWPCLLVQPLRATDLPHRRLWQPAGRWPTRTVRQPAQRYRHPDVERPDPVQEAAALLLRARPGGAELEISQIIPNGIFPLARDKKS